MGANGSKLQGELLDDRWNSQLLQVRQEGPEAKGQEARDAPQEDDQVEQRAVPKDYSVSHQRR